MLIGTAKVSSSGQDAIEMGLYPNSTSISLSNEHQIERAKHLALQMVHAGYAPKLPAANIAVVGDPGIQTFKLGVYNMVEGRMISPYDAFIAEKVATVLCGGEVDPGTLLSEQQFLDLERRVFIELCQQEKTNPLGSSPADRTNLKMEHPQHQHRLVQQGQRVTHCCTFGQRTVNGSPSQCSSPCDS